MFLWTKQKKMIVKKESVSSGAEGQGYPEAKSALLCSCGSQRCAEQLHASCLIKPDCREGCQRPCTETSARNTACCQKRVSVLEKFWKCSWRVWGLLFATCMRAKGDNWEHLELPFLSGYTFDLHVFQICFGSVPIIIVFGAPAYLELLHKHYYKNNYGILWDLKVWKC